MSLSRSIDVNFELGVSFNLPIYGAGQSANLEKVILTPEKSAAKDAVNYTTIQIIDKGIDGSGSTVITEWNNNGGDPDSIDFIAFVANSKSLNYNISRGTTLQLVKVDAAVAVDLGNSGVSICERRI